METIDISYPHMLVMYGMLSVPVLLIFILKIGVIKTTLVAVLRMTLQLALVGLYLDVVFRLNNVWLNFAWLLVMIVVANINVISSSGLKLHKFFFIVLTGIVAGTFFVISLFLFFVVRPSPLYDARYLIPITGMVLGNCLRANVISLERFFESIRNNEKQFLTFLLMGATIYEAALPFLREALKAALAPTISTIATIGLVSLPGMMTGQILGGSFPVVAIKYQLAIMIAIFSATTITTVVNLLLSIRVSFNEYHILRKEVFAG